MNDILRLASAYEFAAVKHVAQRRKGEAAEPYMNHLTEVADLVARATEGADVDLIIAAALHDTIEDTATDYDELAEVFGERVASLVSETTDDKSLPTPERKRLQVEHAPKASTGAKIIKIADKTSNLRAMLNSPPARWTAQRKAEYRLWSLDVVAGCRGVSPWLEAQFDAAAQELLEFERLFTD
jgi:(p)ppGpp synthase/HD superfamily hydrolase